MSSTQPLNPKVVGKTMSLFWGVSVLFLGLAATYFHYCTAFVQLLGDAYIGFAPTPVGIVIGTVWALVDGLVAGIVFALIYNKVSTCCSNG